MNNHCAVGVCSSPVHCNEIGRCFSAPEAPTKAAVAQQACHRIVNIIECVESRCMAADGPVTPTTKEITEDELRRIWLAAKEGAGL